MHEDINKIANEEAGLLLRRVSALHVEDMAALKSKHDAQMAALKSQHEAQMQQLIAKEQDRYEKLQRSHAEHIQSLFSQPQKDEGYESRASTSGRTQAQLPEAPTSEHPGSRGMLEKLHAAARTARWLREGFEEPQTPVAAQVVFSEAGRAVREAESAVQQGKRIMVFTMVTALFLPASFVTSVFVSGLDVLDNYSLGSALIISFLSMLFLLQLPLSLVRVGERISDIPPRGGMSSPASQVPGVSTQENPSRTSNALTLYRGIQQGATRPAYGIPSARRVAKGLLHFVSPSLSWACSTAATQLSNTGWKMWVDCLNGLDWLRGSSRGENTDSVTWTCKCGKRLRLDVREKDRQGAVAFAAQATGPSQQHSIQVTPPPTPSTPETDTQSLASSSRLGTTTTSPSSAPSVSSGGDDGSLDHRHVPKGTPRFLLLCVKRGPGRIVPSALNLTDVIHDTTMFQRIRDEYYGPRPIASGGWRAAIGYGWDLLRKWFLVPRTVEYVKFQLIRLQKSGTRVGSYETGQIPSVKQVYNMEYSYRPCPLDIGPYPIDPAIFMHWFLDPGDHADDQSMAVERLPKKLHSSLEDDMQSTPGGSPIGWGIYIVEGLNWARIQVLALILLLITFLLSVAWSKVREDVQGGMGIGQYLIALIVAVLTVSLLGFTPLEDLARGPAYRQR